jgi:hypothetical protein
MNKQSGARSITKQGFSGIETTRRLLLVATAVVGLIGWLGTPAVSDTSVLAAKVNINNLITATPKPDYEVEVLQPLHQKQKADQIAAERLAEARAAAEAARASEERLLEQQREVQAAQASTPVTGDCQSWMVQAGINDVASAMQVISRESGCNPCSINPGRHDCSLAASQITTACGIGQQLPCGKWPHAWNDPVGGLIDTQNYVIARYGSWAGAWSYWQIHHNY